MAPSATLAAGAAHELSTPLSTIAIVAKELQRTLATTGASTEVRSDLQLVRDQVARCRDILDRMAAHAGENVGVGRSRLVLTTLANVQGRAYAYAPSANGWTKTRLALPENVAVGITSLSSTDDGFFMSVTGFLTPPSIWFGDAAKGTLSVAKTQTPVRPMT